MRAILLALFLAAASFLPSTAALAVEPLEYFPEGTFHIDEGKFQNWASEFRRQETTPERLHKDFIRLRDKTDALLRNSYGRQLAALEEPVLSNCNSGPAIYRLTWLRTFHKPMSFRLQVEEDGSSFLTTKRADGRGGFKPGRLDLKEVTALDAQSTSRIVEEAHDLSLFGLPTMEWNLGLDGASWVMEVCENGKYHVIDRQGGGELANWGLKLMRASGVELGEVY